MADGRYWFKKKRIGWGWTPATREGWIATAVVVIATIVGSALQWKAWLVTLINVGFIAFVIKTGEPLW